jgi:hypothetical protein
VIPVLDCTTCGALGPEACIDGCREERDRRCLLAKMGIGASPRGLDERLREIDAAEGPASAIRAAALRRALSLRAREVLQQFALTLGRLDDGTLSLLARGAMYAEVRELSAGELSRRRELEL